MAVKYPPITGNLFRLILREGISDLAKRIALGEEANEIELMELEMQLRKRNGDSIVSSICQQYRNVSPREYVSDSPLPASPREKKVKLVTVSEEEQQGMEEDPLEVLAKTQPTVSQEFNDIMASLALQLKSGSQSEIQVGKEKK